MDPPPLEDFMFHRRTRAEALCTFQIKTKRNWRKEMIDSKKEDSIARTFEIGHILWLKDIAGKDKLSPLPPLFQSTLFFFQDSNRR